MKLSIKEVTIEAQYPSDAKERHDVRLSLTIEKTRSGAELRVEDWSGDSITIGSDGVTIPEFLEAVKVLYEKFLETQK